MARGTLEPIQVSRDDTFRLHAPNYTDSVLLTTSAIEITMPSSAATVLFSATGNFAVAYCTSAGSTVAAFGTSTPSTNGLQAEINPTIRQVYGYTALSIIGSTANCYMSLAYWSKP